MLTSGTAKSMRPMRKSNVVTFVRHANTCPHLKHESYPRCDCPKWLRWSRDGKQHRQSTGTRTWGTVEKAGAQLQQRLKAGESPATTAAVPPEVWMKTGGRWRVIASHYSVPVKKRATDQRSARIKSSSRVTPVTTPPNTSRQDRSQCGHNKRRLRSRAGCGCRLRDLR